MGSGHQEEINYGAVFFDDPEEHAEGWACAWSENPALRKPIRIAGPHELASDTSWLSNIDYETMRTAQIGGSRFRHSAFLSNKTSLILSEVGFGEPHSQVGFIQPRSIFDGAYPTTASARVGFLAWVFHAVMREANVFLPLDIPPVSDLASVYRDAFIPSASTFYQKDYPNAVINEALESVDIKWTPAAGSAEKREGKVIRLAIDRVMLCQALLDVVYPVGGWKLDTTTVKLLNKRPMDEILLWMDAHPEAMLKVTMTRTDPKYESLVNYGANIENNGSAGHWLTATEVSRLLATCDLTIHAAITASRKTTSRAWVEGNGVQIDHQAWERKAGSYAFHLWCDTLWRGLCKSPQKSPARTKSPASAFVRSVDRELCFYAATKLHDAGIAVRGYGSGAVRIFIPDGTPLQDWIPAVVHAGLTTPILSPGVLPLAWVTSILDMDQPEKKIAPRTLMQAALLLGELQTVISLSDVLAQDA